MLVGSVVLLLRFKLLISTFGFVPFFLFQNETLLDALRTAEAAREALEAEMMGYKSTVEEEASAGAALSENVARLEADLAACREGACVRACVRAGVHVLKNARG